MSIEQGLHAAPFRAVHLQEVRQFVVGAHAVAMVQPDPVRHRNLGGHELIGVSSQLQERLGANLRGQFGIDDGVGRLGSRGASTGGDLHEEVRAAVEAAVEEGGLKDDVRTAPQREEGLGAVGLEGGSKRPSRLATHDRHATRARAVERTKLRDILRENPLLMGIAEAGRAFAHRVLGRRHRWAPSQLGIEFPKQVEGAIRLRDVGRRIDHGRCAVGIEDEHPRTVCRGTDI